MDNSSDFYNDTDQLVFNGTTYSCPPYTSRQYFVPLADGVTVANFAPGANAIVWAVQIQVILRYSPK